MKTETLNIVTDPHPTGRARALLMMADIIAHNTGRVLRADEARDLAWCVLVAWARWALWDWSQVTPKALTGVVNTVAEIVVYRQA